MGLTDFRHNTATSLDFARNFAYTRSILSHPVAFYKETIIIKLHIYVTKWLDSICVKFNHR